MSDSVWPHRRQPTRLPRPWDSPGKNTGVGCHFLLQCMKVKSESEVAQPCPTLSDPMDCSLQGSSIHGIFQARVLEWGAIAFSFVIAHPAFYFSGFVTHLSIHSLGYKHGVTFISRTWQSVIIEEMVNRWKLRHGSQLPFPLPWIFKISLPFPQKCLFSFQRAGQPCTKNQLEAWRAATA